MRRKRDRAPPSKSGAGLRWIQQRFGDRSLVFHRQAEDFHFFNRPRCRFAGSSDDEIGQGAALDIRRPFEQRMNIRRVAALRGGIFSS